MVKEHHMNRRERGRDRGGIERERGGGGIERDTEG